MSERETLTSEQSSMLAMLLGDNAEMWVTSPEGENFGLLRGWEQRGWMAEELETGIPILRAFRITSQGREALQSYANPPPSPIKEE